MKKKLFPTILALVCAVCCMFSLFACAGGGAASVGKKYDSVLYAVDEYAVVMNGEDVSLFKNGKQLRTGYKNIEPIAAETAGGEKVSGFTGYFAATTKYGNYYLISGDGKITSIDGRPVKMFVDVKENSNGLTHDYSAVAALYMRNSDGTYELYDVKNHTHGYADKNIKYIGNDLFFTGSLIMTINGTTVVSKERKDDSIRIYTTGESVVFTHTSSDGTENEYEPTPSPVDPNPGSGSGGTESKTKTALYINSTKIEDDVLYVMSAGNMLVYVKQVSGNPVYCTVKDGSSVTLDYSVDFEGGAFVYDGRVYTVATNGKEDNEEKFGIRELGGAAPSVWYDKIKVHIADVDEGTLKMSGVLECVSGESTKILSFAQNEIMTLSGSVKNLKYKEYYGGRYALMLNTENKLEFDVLGKKKTFDVAGDSVELYDDMFAIVRHGEGKYFATAYFSDMWDLRGADVEVYDDYYRVAGYIFLKSQIKFNNVLQGSSGLGDIDFGTKHIYKGNIDITDKEARETLAAESEIEFVKIHRAAYNDGDGTGLTVCFGTPALGAKYSAIWRDNATDADLFVDADGNYIMMFVYENKTEFCKIEIDNDGRVADRESFSLDGVAEVVTDITGNSYIVAEQNGKHAVYDMRGTLLLTPKYRIAEDNGSLMIACSVAVVKSDESGGYYGVVKLGEKAKDAKLIKKIENTVCMLLPTGDFIFSKTGEPLTLCNKDGKTVAEDIVGVDKMEMSDSYKLGSALSGNEKDREYKMLGMILHFSDGKSAVATFSLKGDEMYQALYNEIL